MPDAPPRPAPFTPQTAPAALEDLRARLPATRWPDTPDEAVAAGPSSWASSAPGVERLRRRRRAALHEGRDPHERHALLAHGNVVRVTEPARGGHFAPFEEPELYAEELRAFFRPYRAAATD
ncbi:MAG TPA: hypothetical protein VLW50_28145 [Streptosporangiaceae bacterium]|nr:hypothetical protein [Streptosporangiaceae bacterium]